MTLKFNNIIFTQQRGQQFHEHLLTVTKDAHLLLDILDCPSQQLEEKLSILDNAKLHFFYNSLSQQQRRIFLLMLLDKVKHCDFQKIISKKHVWNRLFAIQQKFDPQNYRAAELLILLIDSIKNIWNIYELLEQKFIEECFNVPQEELYQPIKNILKEFLSNAYKNLIDLTQNSIFKTQLEKCSPEQSQILIAKTIKLYSWILDGQSLDHFDLEKIYSQIHKDMRADLLQEILQVKHEKTYEIVRKIMEAKVDYNENEFNFILDTQINGSIVSNDFFALIFKNSPQRYNFFQIQLIKNQEKTILFRYNILAFPETVFQNFLPHFMIINTSPHCKKICQIFSQIMQQILTIIKQISEKWSFQALSYQTCKVGLIQYSQQDQQKLLKLCLLIWSNILKIIEMLYNQQAYFKSFFALFFRSQQMKSLNISNSFLCVLNMNKNSKFEIMNSLCFILLQLSYLNPSKYQKILQDNKIFGAQFVNKIKSLLQGFNEDKNKIVHIIYFICFKYEAIKQFGFTGEEHPLNLPQVFQHVYSLDIKAENNIDYSQHSSSHFVGIGKYKQRSLKQLISQVHLNQCPKFALFIRSNFMPLLESINEDILQRKQCRLKFIVQLYLNSNFQIDQIQQATSQIRSLIKSINLCLQLSQDQMISLAQKLKINLYEQIQQYAQLILTILQDQYFKQIKAWSFYNSFYFPSSIINSLRNYLKYFHFLLKAYLKSPIQEKQKPQEPIFSILQIMYNLVNLKIYVNHQLSLFYSNQQLSTLEKHFQETKCLQQTYSINYALELIDIYRRVDQIVECCCKFIAKSKPKIINQYLKRSRFRLAEAMQSKIGHIVADYIVIFQKIIYLKSKRQFGCIDLCFFFFSQYKTQILELFQVIYIRNNQLKNKFSTQDQSSVQFGSQKNMIEFFLKRKRQNRNSLEDYRQLMQSKALSIVEEFIITIFRLCINANQVYINDKIYYGAENQSKIQKSILNTFLIKTQKEFNCQLVRFYYKVISNACENIGQLQKQWRKNETEKQSDIDLPLNSMPIQLLDNNCNDILSKTKLKYIQKLFQHRHSLLDKFVFETAQILYKGKYDKQQLQKQIIIFLSNIIQHLETIISDDKPNLNMLKIELRWLNIIFTQKQQMIINNFISTSFIEKFVRTVKGLIHQQEQHKDQQLQLQLFLPLLEKLLPHTFSSKLLTEYTQYIAKLIAKIAIIIVHAQKRDDIFLSIVSKLLNSKQAQIKQYIPFCLKHVNQNRIGDIISQDLDLQAEQIYMQLEIKSYFFRHYEKQQPKDYVEVKLSDLVSYFKDKYQQNQSKFIEIVKQLASKRIQRIDGKELIYIVYSRTDEFAYSRFIGVQFVNYKPSLNFRDYISLEVNKMAQSLLYNADRLKEFRKIIHNNPVLLPYVVLHPVVVKEQKKRFIDFYIDVVLSRSGEQYLNFLLFLFLDNGSIIKGKSRSFILADYLCFQVAKKLEASQLNIKILLLILYLCQLTRFAKFCHIKFSNLTSSLKEKIQHRFVSSNLSQVKQVDIAIACSFILTILYRDEPLQKLKFHTFFNLKNKNSNYKLTDHCVHPFDGVFSHLESQQKLSENDLFQIDSSQFIQQLQEVKNNLEKALTQNYQGKEMSKDLELSPVFAIDQSILKQIGETKDNLSKLYYNKNISSQIGKQFTKLFNYFIKWKNTNNKSSNKFPDNIIFRERYNVDSVDDEQDDEPEQAPQHRANIQQTRYAAIDYLENRNTVSHSSNIGDNKDLHSMIFSSLKDISPPQEIQIQQINIHEDSTFRSLQSHSPDVQLLINSINSNYRALKKEKFDLTQLNGKVEQQIVEYLKIKELQSDFDLKEVTMSIQQFERYCLSDIIKLERISSSRRNKIKRLEEQMMQIYVRRTSSSDSIDYIIDTIDQNYQHLPPITRAKSTNIVKNDILQKPKLKVLNSHQIPLNAFPQISDQILYQLILLFYVSINELSFENFIPFLQNHKVQNKMVNTLLFIYRNPFGNNVFSKFVFDVHTLAKDHNDDCLKSIRKKIITFLCSFCQYSFYRKDNFLHEETNGKGIKDIVLDLPNQFEGFFSNNLQKPIYQVILYAFDINNATISNKNKVKLLRGLAEVPSMALDLIIIFLAQLNEKYYAGDEDEVSTYINSIQQLDISKNFKQISSNQSFRTRIKELKTPQKLSLNPCFIVAFIDLNIFNTQELKLIHNHFLESGKTKQGELLFHNQILKLYTDEQLENAEWLKNHLAIYVMVLEKYAKTSKHFKKQNCFRLLSLPIFFNFLTFQMKTQFLEAQFEEIRRQNSLLYSDITIHAKRKIGIFESAFEDLRYKTNEFWLTDFSVRFVSHNGQVQSGHGQGVGKDWYTLVTKGMINLNYGLFTKTSQNYYFFNRQSWINPRHLQFFQFIGKIFALSIANKGYYLCPNFSTVIYKMILGQKIQISDLIEQFDEGQVIKNLEKLRQFTDDSMFWQSFVYQDVRLITDKKIQSPTKLQNNDYPQQESNIYLLKESITINNNQKQQESLPQIIKVLKVGQAIELIPGGAKIPVTLQNLQEYIRLTKQKIYDIVINSVANQAKAFLEGFKKIIDLKYLLKFKPQELRLLAEGSDGISIEQLKKYVSVKGYQSTDEPIQWLWTVLEKLSGEDRAYFIQHWTGSPKIPAEGISEMKLAIYKAKDDKRIFAQTCFNRINLPSFSTKQELQEGVLTAINLVKMGLSILEDH